MNRRKFLRRSSPVASLACLAGCLGSANRDAPSGNPTEREPARDDTDATTADPSTTRDRSDERDATTDTAGDDPGDFSGVDSAADEPFQSLSVGSREGVAFPDNNRPRDVRVWNGADSPREITVQVSRDAKVLLDRTVEFDADAYLTVALNEPADYRVAVGLADEQSTTFRVQQGSFDCNATTTDVGVAPDGRVQTVTASTMMGCPSSEIAATDFSVDEGECGTENSASVAYDGEQVRVDGTVRSPTPRSDLELGDASYDGEAGSLTVRVRAAGGDDEAETTGDDDSGTSSDDFGPGVQCVGEVPYEASVDFEYDLPGEVVVVHESMDGTVEVARATR